MTWTTVTDAQLAVNKPARSADIKAIRDNITALANGDAGAPQVQTAAIADLAVTPAKFADGGVTKSKLIAPTAGDTVISTAGLVPGVEYTTNSTTNVVVATYETRIAGTYRMTIDHRRTSGGNNAYVSLYKNGSVISEITSITSTWATRTWDVACSVGDILQFYHRTNTTGTESGSRSPSVKSGTDALG